MLDSEQSIDELAGGLLRSRLTDRSQVVVNGILVNAEATHVEGAERWKIWAEAEGPRRLGPGFHAWLDRYEDYWAPVQVMVDGPALHQTVMVQILLNPQLCEQDDLADSLIAASGLARRIGHVLSYPPKIDNSGQPALGYEDLCAELGERGLPTPPVPPELRPFVVAVSPLCWATGDVDPMRLYLGPDVAGDLAPTDDEYFAFALGGHGLGSNFLLFELNHAGMRLWDRTGYGNAYGADGEHELACHWLENLNIAVDAGGLGGNGG